MKKIATTLFLAFVCFGVNAQYLIITKDGVKAKEGNTSYATVEFPGQSKDEIKNAIANAVGTRWHYPDRDMDITDSWIVVRCLNNIASGGGKDMIEGIHRFQIIDGKVNFFFDFKCIYFRGDSRYTYGCVRERGDNYGIFSKKGKVKSEKRKEAVENYINSEIEWFVGKIEDALVK